MMSSERLSAARNTAASRSRSSPTMVFSRTSIPFSFNLRVRNRELLSVWSGVRSSEPTAMISASIEEEWQVVSG